MQWLLWKVFMMVTVRPQFEVLVVELLKLLVQSEHHLSYFGHFIDKLLSMVSRAPYSLVYAPIFHQHFLMMTFDLIMISSGQEEGHMHEDLIFLASELVLESPSVVTQVQDVCVILVI